MNFEISLPSINNPVANYIAYKKVGNLVFVSGQTCRENGAMKFVGRVGKDLNVEEGKLAARLCGLNILSQIKLACEGNLRQVKSCVRLNVFVSSAEDFFDHALIANGASDLMVEVFGDAGKPTRTSVGVYSLPSNSAVEIDAIFEIF
jgi:enamine deaminase RidA (YjgF/YER057c/UK114 family)